MTHATVQPTIIGDSTYIKIDQDFCKLMIDLPKHAKSVFHLIFHKLNGEAGKRLVDLDFFEINQKDFFIEKSTLDRGINELLVRNIITKSQDVKKPNWYLIHRKYMFHQE